jgi:hypothetical protein
MCRSVSGYNLKTTKRIFIECDIGEFHYILLTQWKFGYNVTKITDTVLEELPLCLSVRISNVSRYV